jgi:hypothetical protein
MKMEEIDIQDYAQQLFEGHGDRAVVEAAQKASTFERKARRKTPKLGGTSKRL